MLHDREYPNVIAMFTQMIEAVQLYCQTKAYPFSVQHVLQALQYHVPLEQSKIERFFMLVDYYDLPTSIDIVYRADYLDQISIDSHLGGLNAYDKIRVLAMKHRIPCKKILNDYSSYSPLEKMAIKRMRVPEPLEEKYSKEFWFDRWLGISGYDQGDLEDIMQLLPLLAESGSSLDLKTILDLDYRVFENIPTDMRLDLEMSVPIKADRPYVDVHIHGYLSEGSIARGWYLLAMDIEKKSLRLIYDTTVIHSTLLQHKYNLDEKYVIL